MARTDHRRKYISTRLSALATDAGSPADSTMMRRDHANAQGLFEASSGAGIAAGVVRDVAVKVAAQAKTIGPITMSKADAKRIAEALHKSATVMEIVGEKVTAGA